MLVRRGGSLPHDCCIGAISKGSVMHDVDWVTVAWCGSGSEAEVAIERLRQGGVYAVNGGSHTGVAGFPTLCSGPCRGVEVLVPVELVDEAALLLEAA